jgi:quercetin dioxygenase-like cupin family protein
MRLVFLAALLVGTAVAASAQPAPSTGAMQTYDIPTTGKPQTFYMLHRVLKPNEVLPLHSHRGVEITWVVRGTIRLTMAGRSRIYHAGESFLIPRGVAHSPANAGSDEAEVAVNYILDKGAPLSDPAPAGH